MLPPTPGAVLPEELAALPGPWLLIALPAPGDNCCGTWLAKRVADESQRSLPTESWPESG